MKSYYQLELLGSTRIKHGVYDGDICVLLGVNRSRLRMRLQEKRGKYMRGCDKWRLQARFLRHKFAELR